MNYRPLTMKSLLEEIVARQDNRELENPMEGLRSVFEPGEKAGDIFIALLHAASQRGLINGVSFTPKGALSPEDAVWDGARLTFAGKTMLSRL
jgi:hypothetical protein